MSVRARWITLYITHVQCCGREKFAISNYVGSTINVFVYYINVIKFVWNVFTLCPGVFLSVERGSWIVHFFIVAKKTLFRTPMKVIIRTGFVCECLKLLRKPWLGLRKIGHFFKPLSVFLRNRVDKIINLRTKVKQNECPTSLVLYNIIYIEIYYNIFFSQKNCHLIILSGSK